jgi:hypothetical protein
VTIIIKVYCKKGAILTHQLKFFTLSFSFVFLKLFQMERKPAAVNRMTQVFLSRKDQRKRGKEQGQRRKDVEIKTVMI